jgi:hypothetical protein
MPMARRYQAFEARQLLQKAEHQPSPVTGKDAHSRTLHAGATPGGLGATPTNMMQRTHKNVGESNRQFSRRGGTPRTSSFKNQLHQADAVSQALNSVKGQMALRVLDMPTHAGLALRTTIEFGPIKEAAFMPGSAIAPMTTVHKNDAGIQKPVGGVAGIRLILDRGAGQSTFHIQTCMPLDTMAVGKYQVKNMAPGGAMVAQG